MDTSVAELHILDFLVFVQTDGSLKQLYRLTPASGRHSNAWLVSDIPIGRLSLLALENFHMYQNFHIAPNYIPQLQSSESQNFTPGFLPIISFSSKSTQPESLVEILKELISQSLYLARLPLILVLLLDLA